MKLINRLKTILFYWLVRKPRISEVCPIELQRYKSMIAFELKSHKDAQIQILKGKNEMLSHRIEQLKQLKTLKFMEIK